VNDDELQQRLYAGDPASDLTPADPARVARLLEDTMNADLTDATADEQHEHDGEHESRETGIRNRSPLTWLVAAAAVLLAAVGVFSLLGNDPDPADVPSAGPTSASTPTSMTVLTAPAETNGRCMAPNAQALATAQLAFSGTVETVSADRVEIVPDRFYQGDPVDVIEVRAPAQQMTALVGAVRFEEGRRYLVSTTNSEVTVCGFSGPYSPDLEALYVEAFPG
jgi:hypothetical protein